MGDLKVRIGCGDKEDVVGAVGLGIRNDRGETLVYFCREQNFAIMNTFFKLPSIDPIQGSLRT